MRSLVEQTVLVLSQALNGSNYQKRTNILLGIIADPKKVKDLLKEISCIQDDIAIAFAWSSVSGLS